MNLIVEDEVIIPIFSMSLSSVFSLPLLSTTSGRILLILLCFLVFFWIRRLGKIIKGFCLVLLFIHMRQFHGFSWIGEWIRRWFSPDGFTSMISLWIQFCHFLTSIYAKAWQMIKLFLAFLQGMAK